MSNLLINNEKPFADSKHDTFEGNILKNVIREAWKEGFPSKEKDGKERSKEAVYELDEHAMNMRRILSSYEYEIASMPIVVANTARMSREERKQYLAHLEAIALGSTHLFGPEFASVMMLGMPKKARDHHSASRYTSLLLKKLEKRQNHYRVRISKEGESMQNASARLILHSSSIFRFFRKSKITSLKRIIEIRSSRIRKFETRADRYSYLLQKVREKSRAGS